MKHLLFAALLLFTSAARAQSWASELPANSATQQIAHQSIVPVAGTAEVAVALLPTHADSIEAIRRAFRHYRRFVRIGTLALGGAVSTQVVLVTSGQFDGAGSKKALGIIAPVINMGFLVAYIVQWARFSKHQEDTAIQRFELHQPQPLYIRRRLVAYAVSKGRF